MNRYERESSLGEALAMWAMWIVAIGAFVGYWLESATPLIIALAALVVGVVIAIFAD